MDSGTPNAKFVGRGAGINPPNRFERVRAEDDWEHLDPQDDPAQQKARPDCSHA